MLRLICISCWLAAVFSPAVHADSVNIGLVSFDTLIPGTPGVNVFNISNFTGAFALPPDFRVMTPLTFLDSGLTLVGDSGTQTILLGDIGPGFLVPPVTLQFPDTTLFSSATFFGTLSQTSFVLSDHSTFVASSPFIRTVLLPSAGEWLVAGRDFAVITVSNVPEPGNIPLMFLASMGLVARLRLRRMRRQSEE